MINYPMYLHNFNGQIFKYRKLKHIIFSRKIIQLHLMSSHLANTKICVLEAERKMKEKHLL